MMPSHITPLVRSVMFCAILLLPFTLSHARVGETTAECDHRYGTPVQADAEMRMYQKSGMIIGVFTEKDLCWKIVYAHPDRSPLGAAEIKAVLSLYGEWKEYENLSPTAGTIWVSTGKTALAAFVDNVRSDGTLGTRGLCIYDRGREIRKGIEEEINAKVKARMEGL